MEAIALYDYEAKKEGRLSLQKDDRIKSVRKVQKYDSTCGNIVKT